MPAHNSEKTILRAVESVLAQTESDFELLVIDDGSTDGTRRIVRSVADPRLRYHLMEHGGVSSARNRGIAESLGDIVTFLDSDDQAYPDWLATFGTLMEDQRVGIAFCGMDALGPDGNIATLVLESATNSASGVDGRFLSGSYAVRRSLLTHIGGFDDRLRYSENTEIGLRLMQACSAEGLTTATCVTPLVCWSRPDFDRRNAPARLENRIAAGRIMLDKHGEHPLFRYNPRVASYYHAIVGVSQARLGRLREARASFVEAIRADPRQVRNYARFLAALSRWSAARAWGIDKGPRQP
jgi:glycosyltransferase involved in cell wall biosynthesis